MTQYHKIETVFERDMDGTKKLIEGKFRNKTVEYLKDSEWMFTEKIDGMNIRVHWDGHKITFGGRTDNAQINANLIQHLSNKFAGAANEELFEQAFGETPVTFYGEGIGKKIQKDSVKYVGGYELILFDIFINGIWLERENVEDIAKTFGVPVAPVVLRGTIQEAVDYVKGNPNSVIATESKAMEGLVGTPLIELRDRLGKRIIVKIKARDFGDQ